MAEVLITKGDITKKINTNIIPRTGDYIDYDSIRGKVTKVMITYYGKYSPVHVYVE